MAARRALRQRRGRLLDRRPAREGEDLHQRRRSRSASRSSSISLQGAARAADPGAAPCRQVRRPPAVAAAQLQRARRLATSRPGCRTLAPSQNSARPRSDPHRPARDAAGGRRGDRRQHRPTASPASCSTCATSASPTTPSSSIFATTAGTGASTACRRRTSRTRNRSARRCSSAIRSSRRCRARETLRAQHRHRSDVRRARRRAACRSSHDGTSLVRLLDGTQPTWRSDFLTEGWPANHLWAPVREAHWKYTELPVTPGDPTTAFEHELYDLVSDPSS